MEVLIKRIAKDRAIALLATEENAKALKIAVKESRKTNFIMCSLEGEIKEENNWVEISYCSKNAKKEFRYFNILCENRRVAAKVIGQVRKRKINDYYLDLILKGKNLAIYIFDNAFDSKSYALK